MRETVERQKLVSSRLRLRGAADINCRAKLGLLGGSILFSLIMSEVVARLVLPSPLPWRYPQLRYRPDPELVFVLEPNQRAYSADKRADINGRGLRGRLVPYNRVPGRKRLLFLGDSIVFGYGVEEEEGVSARVEKLLNDHGIPSESIDTAVPSYNTEQEVSFLEREGIRYSPDWVIVGVCWNDISRKSGVTVSPEGWLVGSTDESRGSIAEWLESPLGYSIRNTFKSSRALFAALEGWRFLHQDSSLKTYNRLRNDVLEGRDTAEVAAGWDRLGNALDRVGILSRRYGFHALVVTFPFALLLEQSYPESSYPSRVRKLAVKVDVDFLDLRERYQREYQGHESLFIPYDGDHPNAAGHALAAQEIVDFVLRVGEERDREAR